MAEHCVLIGDERVAVHIDDRDDGARVYTVAMRAGENRLDRAMCSSLANALAAIERDIASLDGTRIAATVLVSESKKYFSLGLDLGDYYAAARETPGGSAQRVFEKAYVRGVLAALITHPLHTVAAVSGHAVAGGLVLALCCDCVVMRRGQKGGLIGMNEVRMPASVPAAMAAVVRERCSTRRFLNAVLLGGELHDAAFGVEAGLVDDLVECDSADTFIGKCRQIALAGGHPVSRGPFVRLIKREVHSEALRAMDTPETTDHFAHALSLRSRI